MVLGLVKGILYEFVGIFKGIGNGNVIWFCNYNRKHSMGGWVLGKGLVTGILYGFDIDNEGICFKNFKLFWKR